MKYRWDAHWLIINENLIIIKKKPENVLQVIDKVLFETIMFSMLQTYSNFP